MYAGVIFDLDNTLVDTEVLAALRKAKGWREAVANIGKTQCFADVKATVKKLRASGVRVGVVTTSVSFYAEKVLSFHELEHDVLIAYHDCFPGKPSGAPVTKCVQRLGLTAKQVVAVGDSLIDADAYGNADVVALGAGWSPYLDLGAKWHEVIKSPTSLLKMTT